jgi:hypothetical protein
MTFNNMHQREAKIKIKINMLATEHLLETVAKRGCDWDGLWQRQG